MHENVIHLSVCEGCQPPLGENYHSMSIQRSDGSQVLGNHTSFIHALTHLMIFPLI